ncbi:MAG TPA: PHB depolymerase family esterase [Allosphingosinicella sp.]|jgi:poly(hydroxyalkanoate) depolymerase family esterase|uniref:extracellular catalytic domain type 1 short-chain-length polyhydroxyalkanoate depolymerase n=1 Tax=Allosphingosinicella sp. TaxID=2823234 RepID=UPI002F2AB4E5
MRVSETIKRLKATRPKMAEARTDRLTDLPAFGRNPGNLRARIYLPDHLPAGAPLVVVLHGCTQNAAGYDEGSGWSRLADRHGFALLFPEQQRANNSNLCFNWFQPGDATRGAGEAESIRQMVERVTDRHGVDRTRVFVTGLSAGGAMASVMLATYPELFAGGAVIAGLAYGCATDLGEALACMSGRGRAAPTILGNAVRAASPHRGPWPRVSVWHGSADHIVNSGNGDDVVQQWLSVHSLEGARGTSDRIDGYPRRQWRGPDGRVLVEQLEITGMGHGTPLDPGQVDGKSGVAGPHMLDVAISSTDRIAEFWGIADQAKVSQPRRPAPVANGMVESIPRLIPTPIPPAARPTSSVQATIENALRSAGLMR